MNILVIGGSGFLGSHVADQLSEAGHSVSIFDRVPSPWLRDDQRMIIGDLLDQERISDAIKGCDIVYNFAALADLNQAIDKPIDTARINILGNIYVLEACRVHNVRRFLYASTVYVFSREGGFYRCSKQASENYVEEYQRIFGMNYTILRYGSLYGPRSDESNGLYRVVKKALETGRICYEGSPDALREYIHVEDAARASVTAIGEEFRNQSVVLTGQEPMRVHDLLKMLAEILGRPDSVEFSDGEQIGHYVRTPYSYQPKLGRKFIPPLHVDLGQGLLQLIDEVRRSSGQADSLN
ncbi:3-beta hydroxysteroid dehydrogenase/isomerase family protein [Leptospira inadai serovar Lyme str. 10]|uniref:3-beta hydroxysteroid dehydrogenase/isomerase family protein n=2 Tax=Leptospira inadai serovar Lyme TaxID=293084 RepID=V6HCM7_9LEPT|nr:NAD(P)-dependent oxidoreductase [Leptospira inadai]EQA36653.1 3-beta hydroxysteroid dehydrogenase/isomerase family protein [Leptospira inadai serovar Lyme str. 10]PNV76511.1 NAD-dependent epimerase [Leptospira inadai serovar Lyme]